MFSGFDMIPACDRRADSTRLAVKLALRHNFENWFTFAKFITHFKCVILDNMYKYIHALDT